MRNFFIFPSICSGANFKRLTFFSDINECEEDEVDCEFGCTNTPGSYHCLPEGGELQEEQEKKVSSEEEKEIQDKDYEDEDEDDEHEEENNEVNSKVINFSSRPASLSGSSHCPPGYGPSASDPEECTGRQTSFLQVCFFF